MTDVEFGKLKELSQELGLEVAKGNLNWIIIRENDEVLRQINGYKDTYRYLAVRRNRMKAVQAKEEIVNPYKEKLQWACEEEGYELVLTGSLVQLMREGNVIAKGRGYEAAYKNLNGQSEGKKEYNKKKKAACEHKYNLIEKEGFYYSFYCEKCLDIKKKEVI